MSPHQVTNNGVTDNNLCQSGSSAGDDHEGAELGPSKD